MERLVRRRTNWTYNEPPQKLTRPCVRLLPPSGWFCPTQRNFFNRYWATFPSTVHLRFAFSLVSRELLVWSCCCFWPVSLTVACWASNLCWRLARRRPVHWVPCQQIFTRKLCIELASTVQKCLRQKPKCKRISRSDMRATAKSLEQGTYLTVHLHMTNRIENKRHLLRFFLVDPRFLGLTSQRL